MSNMFFVLVKADLYCIYECIIMSCGNMSVDNKKDFAVKEWIDSPSVKVPIVFYLLFQLISDGSNITQHGSCTQYLWRVGRPTL